MLLVWPVAVVGVSVAPFNPLCKLFIAFMLFVLLLSTMLLVDVKSGAKLYRPPTITIRRTKIGCLPTRPLSVRLMGLHLNFMIYCNYSFAKLSSGGELIPPHPVHCVLTAELMRLPRIDLSTVCY